MKLSAFDLEISTIIPDGETDWWKLSPLGISCAAVCSNDEPGPVYKDWSGYPRMTAEQATGMVGYLRQMTQRGYKLLTWNGLSFDFRVLAQESGQMDEVVDLALNHHIDLMFIVFAYKGHYLSLQSASKGMGLDGKLKNAVLKDGTRIDDMDGAKAPKLWQQGEYAVVLRYVRHDAYAQLALGEHVLAKGGIGWYSKKGNYNSLPIRGILPTVRECLLVPEPKVSWMDKPPQRREFFEWMGEKSPL